MALFYADSIVLYYVDVDAARRWWIETFGCAAAKLPAWDNPLPSDTALRLPGNDQATLLLSSRSEAQQAGLELPVTIPIIFCSKLKKALEYCTARGIPAGPIQDGGDTQFFEISDSEGHTIEITVEP